VPPAAQRRLVSRTGRSLTPKLVLCLCRSGLTRYDASGQCWPCFQNSHKPVRDPRRNDTAVDVSAAEYTKLTSTLKGRRTIVITLVPCRRFAITTGVTFRRNGGDFTSVPPATVSGADLARGLLMRSLAIPGLANSCLRRCSPVTVT